jgi:hypothetical protein
LVGCDDFLAGMLLIGGLEGKVKKGLGNIY